MLSVSAAISSGVHRARIFSVYSQTCLCLSKQRHPFCPRSPSRGSATSGSLRAVEEICPSRLGYSGSGPRSRSLSSAAALPAPPPLLLRVDPVFLVFSLFPENRSCQNQNWFPSFPPSPHEPRGPVSTRIGILDSYYSVSHVGP